MKIRIKEKNDHGIIYYRVQVKRFLGWKTLYETEFLDKAFECVENLTKIDEFNNPKKEVIVLHGWMARNQYDFGISKQLEVFSHYPTYRRGNDKTSIYWVGDEIAAIKTNTHLFGEVGLEPREVKITIEKL